jgi:coenzyme PQQ biosynthesis protein PqqD
MSLTADSVPSLWRLARLGHDAVRQRPVLLYPEGAVLLNDSAKEILELVDGTRTIADIAGVLNAKYGTDTLADVTDCLATLMKQELIRDH